jgi:hypothetical protein
MELTSRHPSGISRWLVNFWKICATVLNFGNGEWMADLKQNMALCTAIIIFIFIFN